MPIPFPHLAFLGLSAFILGPSHVPAAEDVRIVRDVPYVRPGGPPVLIIHGEEDDRVPIAQSEELAAALARDGVDHEFRRVPGAGHGLRLRTTWDAKPLGTDLAPVLVAFLKKHLAPAKDSVPAATPAR